MHCSGGPSAASDQRGPNPPTPLGIANGDRPIPAVPGLTMIQRLLKSLTANPIRQADVFAVKIAEQSANQVLARVAGRTDCMTLCETRGYIRARAASEIRRQTRIAMSDRSADAGLTALVIRRSTERIVPLVLRRLAAPPQSAAAARRQAA